MFGPDFENICVMSAMKLNNNNNFNCKFALDPNCINHLLKSMHHHQHSPQQTNHYYGFDVKLHMYTVHGTPCALRTSYTIFWENSKQYSWTFYKRNRFRFSRQILLKLTWEKTGFRVTITPKSLMPNAHHHAEKNDQFFSWALANLCMYFVVATIPKIITFD